MRRSPPTRRSGARGALLSSAVSLGLAALSALAIAAPLLHAHLDAAASAPAGLCGEHQGETPIGGGDVGPCGVCLVAGKSPAALARDAARICVPAPRALAHVPHDASPRAAPERGRAAPRAPPALG